MRLDAAACRHSRRRANVALPPIKGKPAGLTGGFFHAAKRRNGLQTGGSADGGLATRCFSGCRAEFMLIGPMLVVSKKILET